MSINNFQLIKSKMISDIFIIFELKQFLKSRKKNPNQIKAFINNSGI
jgi:hypothetical protein